MKCKQISREAGVLACGREVGGMDAGRGASQKFKEPERQLGESEEMTGSGA